MKCHWKMVDEGGIKGREQGKSNFCGFYYFFGGRGKKEEEHLMTIFLRFCL